MPVKRLLPALALLAALLAANLVLPPWYEAQFKPPAEIRSQTDVFLDLLGELRTFLARVVFMKADVYHHVMESQGIYWTEERDILPIYRMASLLDPKLEEAYDTAAWDLVVNYDRVDEGLSYLEEGLRSNPDSARLYFTKAFLQYQVGRYEEAARAAERAMWLATEYFDQLNSIRLLGHSCRKLGDLPAEVHTLRILLTLRPDDPFAIQRMKQLGLEPRGFTPEEIRAQVQPRLGPSPTPPAP